jgi:hypothetical protein
MESFGIVMALFTVVGIFLLWDTRINSADPKDFEVPAGPNPATGRQGGRPGMEESGLRLDLHQNRAGGSQGADGSRGSIPDRTGRPGGHDLGKPRSDLRQEASADPHLRYSL